MDAIKLILTIAILTSVNLNCLGQEETSNEKLIQKMSKSAIWTPELDAVIASPKNHKVILENDKVRVLEITLLPNETENLHHISGQVSYIFLKAMILLIMMVKVIF